MCKSFLVVVYYISIIVFLVTINLTCRRAYAQNNQLPSALVQSLQKYSKLDSTTLSWEGTILQVFKGKKYTESISGSYARSGQKFAWVRILKNGKKLLAEHEVRFDGSTIAESNDSSQLTWQAIEKLANTQPNESTFEIPYFDAIGVYYPRENRSLVQGKLSSKILHLLENGAELVRCVEETLGDKKVTLVEIEAAHEALWGQFENLPDRDRLLYYLSSTDDFGVIKHERRTTSGKKWFESSVTSFSTASTDLPTIGGGVTIKIYLNPDGTDFQIVNDARAVMVLNATTSVVGTNNDDAFVLKMESAKAGAQLIDAVSPEFRKPDGSISVFSMPASPEDLDKAIAAASVKRSVTPRILWGVGLTVLVGGGLASYLRYRRSRKV